MKTGRYSHPGKKKKPMIPQSSGCGNVITQGIIKKYKLISKLINK